MTHMYEHFKNIENLYGKRASVQIPNGLFKDLSSNIKSKNGSTNIQQASFSYAYLVTVAFLYKYAHFVDLDNGTYVQNADIKQVLGYGKSTKTIDKIIKKDGVLEQLGLVETTNDYPIGSDYSDEEYNGNKIRTFTTISEINSNHINYDSIRRIVKNRNYEIKEPTFLFEYKSETGTLYEYSNTHKITIEELINLFDYKFDNIDFFMYGFFKSKCQNLKDNMKAIALNYIVCELGIGKDAFYTHLKILKDNRLMEVNHKNWVMSGEAESNEYYFKGF